MIPPNVVQDGCPAAEGERQVSRRNLRYREGHLFCHKLAFKARKHCTPGEGNSGQDLPMVFVIRTRSYFFFSLLKIYPSSNPPETAAPCSLIDMGGKHLSNVPRAPSAVCTSPHQSQLSGEPQRERSAMQNSPSLAITSASITAQPSSRSTATTVLFPDAIPPESPTRNIVL